MKIGLISSIFLAYLSGNALAARPAGNVMIQGVDAQCTSFGVATSGSTTTYTCVGGPPPSGAPTNCVATVNGGATVNFAHTGGTAMLSVVCDQTSGVSYNWARNGTPGLSSVASFSDVLPSNATGSNITYSYRVTACIGAACVTVPPGSLTAVVAASGSFSGSCPGFDNTYVLEMSWASPTRLYALAMGPNDIVLVHFTVGSGNSPNNNLPKIGGAEYGSTPTARYAVLSATPCDFTAQTWPGASASGYSVTVPFAVGTGSNFGYYPILTNSTQYYFNVKNLQGAGCASSGNCAMFFDLSHPGF
jgi:hypothetical protein